VDLDPVVGSPLVPPPLNPRHPLSPLVLQPSPPPLSLCWPPPPSLSLSFFPKRLQPPALNPSRPPSPPLQGAALPAWFSDVWVRTFHWSWKGGRKKKGRRKGRTQGDFVIIFFVFVLQSNWLHVYQCESVEVLSRIFVGGRTTVVLLVSGDFLWVISGNQYENTCSALSFLSNEYLCPQFGVIF
jgi:hypothetical protein